MDPERGRARERRADVDHGRAQLARRARPERRNRAAGLHAAPELGRLLAVQGQHVAQALLQLLGRQRIAQPPALAPGGKDPVGQIESLLDAPAAQRLDARVGNLQAQGQARGAVEEFAVDGARLREQALGGGRPGPRTLGERLRRAADRQRVLAGFLGDVLGEQRLDRRQRQPQRQRRAQPRGRALTEFPEQPAVQPGECLFAVQPGAGSAAGFTARWNPSMP